MSRKELGTNVIGALYGPTPSLELKERSIRREELVVHFDCRTGLCSSLYLDWVVAPIG